MGLAQPIMLAFLGLFIPVVALYLLKQRRRRVQVSTLLFWDRILQDEQTVTSLTRLKKLLSLLLQLLFITLLAFALARPLLSEGLTGARRIVLLLDTSASMLVQEGDQNRFALAKEKSLGLVKGMAQGDTMMLVSVGQQAELVRPFTNSKRELESALESVQPQHTETNFAAALELLNLLPKSDQETHVYLVTDGAFSPVEYTPSRPHHFAYLKIGETEGNVGITAFQVRPLPDSPNDFQIHMEIANHSQDNIVAPMELRLNGALTDAYEVSIPANESIKRLIRQYSADGGTVEVFIDHPDPFPLDNRAYGQLSPPEPTSVQLVIDGNLFLETALLTDRNVQLEVVGPSEVKPTSEFDINIFATAVPDVTPPGNSIFINRWPQDLGIGNVGTLDAPLISDWDRDHPINRHLSLQNIAISSARKLELPDSFTPLVSSFDAPLIAIEETLSRKVLVIAFDPLASDLPLRVAFPMLIANAVRYLPGTDIGERWLNPPIGTDFSGPEIRNLAPNPELASAIQEIILPDSTRQSLDSAASLVRADQVGLYLAASKQDDVAPLFAVNLASPQESRITVGSQLPINSKDPLPEIKSGFRLGYEPWFFVALIAIILSITEWILFHRRIIE